eukprot:3047807-Pleurochrysis_carterae.AAC.3
MTTRTAAARDSRALGVALPALRSSSHHIKEPHYNGFVYCSPAVISAAPASLLEPAHSLD